MALGKIKRKIRFWTALGAALLMLNVAHAADVALPAIPVNIGHHADYTRIVFEFPKLYAYHVKDVDGVTRIDFDTKAPPAFSALKSPLVKSIKDTSDAVGLKVDLGLVAGATVKHYRLKRKVIVDVYPASGAEPAPKDTPVAQTAKKTPVIATPPSPAAVAEKPLVKETPTTPSDALSDPADLAAKKIPKAVTRNMPVAEKISPHQTAAEPLPAAIGAGEETNITLSSLLPMRLAVFERFGTFWIVTDSDSVSAALPVIAGPMKEFIRPPRVLRFEGGVAYRYALPKKFYPQVSKQNLLWKIALLEDPPPPDARSDSVKIEFDRVSRKAKLLVSLKGAGNTLAVEDPAVGDTLYVVPTSTADQAIRKVRSMTDFEIVPALLGLVVRPLRDAISVLPVNDVVLFTAPAGLTVTPEGVGTPVLIGEADAVADDAGNRLFDFPNWRQGGLRQFQEIKQEIQEEIVSASTPEDRAGHLMKLALLYFSNNFGHEALGLLEMVLQENAEMDKNTDFIAIRGAASAMAGHYKEALQDLSTPAIQQHPEVNLWIGFAAAATEQWRMADRSFPKSNRLLLGYPDNIAIPFTIYMAESSLRLGHTDTAKQLLDSVNMTAESFEPRHKAAIDYLRGETFSQQGQFDKAEEIWRPVAGGIDRLYHTKASLALTRLLLKQKKISLKEAVEQLENLRFAWRGDGLEVSILRALGSLKVQDNQVLSGLQDIKRAADLADSLLDDSTPIRDEMKIIFADLFVGDQATKISPLEAVAVFNEFISLLPSGAEGVAATLDFADYLIRMDLLGKAAEIIESQISGGGVSGERITGAGTKLAAIYLLDGRPQQALEALQETERSGAAATALEERALLKARAQSQLKQTDAAIGTLSGFSSRNAKRLRADVLWRAQRWDDAAAAIENLLSSAVAPFTEEDAALVVNAAVAWKLAGNVNNLRQIRSKYDVAMSTTKLAQTFGVVTRDGGASDLADHETMLKISGEVDMFKGFLDSYKAVNGKGS